MNYTIEYVEIRDKATRKLIGNIDTAKSIIWSMPYYGVGEFEIYVAATEATLALLKYGNYVTRHDREDCGIIEKINIEDTAEDGRMITASGRFCKAILDRRIVYEATLKGTGMQYWWSCKAAILNGNVETAVRGVINKNAVNAVNVNRNIPEIYWTDEDVTGLTEKITVQTSSTATEAAEKQVTYKKLLSYTDGVLEEYKLGAKMWLDRDLLRFRYKIYKGVDRSRDNTDGRPPLVFSQDFDNLLETNYAFDDTEYKTTALIGGEGDGEERICAFAYEWIKGLDRRETFVDASTLTQEEGMTVEAYRKQLETQGQQAIAALQKIETFDGKLDLTNSSLRFGEDYSLGDIVTVEDPELGKYINARIVQIDEVQDDDGYHMEVDYGA